MSLPRRLGVAVLVSLVLAAFPLPSGLALAGPSSWNDANFRLVWERTDKPVDDGATNRSWIWGPGPLRNSPSREPYIEAPGGSRTVEYFDKSRMEVNDPNGDRSELWFVTNGLLVREMVSGEVQTGNDSFANLDSSKEAVAGDPASANPNSPTYATFKNLASLNNDHPASTKTGFVNESVNKSGAIATLASSSSSPDAGVVYAYFEHTLKHNIPNVFWDYMNQTGSVYWNGASSTDTVVDWVFALGLPITEPYWTKAKVAGVERDVLVQLFERRVLTYTPSNPAGFKVEMGNVGQHYYRWRYGGGGQIAFVSKRSGSNQVWTMDVSGGNLKQLTGSGQNGWPTWSPDNSKIAFHSNRDGNYEIYVMNADGSDQQRLTNTDVDDLYPTWSPDGSRIAWEEASVVYTMAANGSDVKKVSSSNSIETYPVWSPDGSAIAWSSDSSGSPEVWRAKSDGSGLKRLTTGGGDNKLPTDWSGGKILFVCEFGGPSKIWTMNDDGSSQTQLATGGDYRARYSPDRTKIVFGKNNEIYVMNVDGSNQMNLTNDGSPDWQADWSN
jgi:hypothetical protein